MSKHALINVDYADGTYAFRLALGGIEEVEEKCNASIFEVHDALAMRTARSRWIAEVIRVGLIGGGMPPADALAKVRRYCDERPLEESRDVAHAVVLAGLARVHGDDVAGEAEPAEKPKAPKPRRRKGSTSGQSVAAPR